MNAPQAIAEAPYLSVKQAAKYLQLNQKKIYQLANQGVIPATKITGKWMFPRELLDRWMLNSSHNGLLSDRLIIAGSDDPLLTRVVAAYTLQIGNKALISYSPTSTHLGLELLQAHRLDVCCMHWGPEKESDTRHPALLQHFSQHEHWVLIRGFKREHGLIVRPELLKHAAEPSMLFDAKFRWVRRQRGSGTLRLQQETLSQYGKTAANLNTQVEALSEREAVAALHMNKADITPGTKGVSREFNQGFIGLGWESFDFALPRSIWFRHLFQDLIKQIKSHPIQHAAEQLGGYDFADTGALIWGAE